MTVGSKADCIIELAPATIVDADTLLRWLNSSDSLKWKRKTRTPITASEHAAWLAKTLADADAALWLIKHDGKSIGQVRLQREDDVFAIDIYIDGPFRNHGFATTALTAAVARFRRSHRDAAIVADIHKDNRKSRQLFERLDFRPIGEAGDWQRYGLTSSELDGVTKP